MQVGSAVFSGVAGIVMLPSDLLRSIAKLRTSLGDAVTRASTPVLSRIPADALPGLSLDAGMSPLANAGIAVAATVVSLAAGLGAVPSDAHDPELGAAPVTSAEVAFIDTDVDVSTHRPISAPGVKSVPLLPSTAMMEAPEATMPPPEPTPTPAPPAPLQASARPPQATQSHPTPDPPPPATHRPPAEPPRNTPKPHASTAAPAPNESPRPASTHDAQQRDEHADDHPTARPNATKKPAPAGRTETPERPKPSADH